MLLLLASLSLCLASSVFVLDDADDDTNWMVHEMIGVGHRITLSSELGFHEWEFEGGEVDLDAYDVVLWMDGNVASGRNMPVRGQAALLEFVQAGGGIMLFGQHGYNYLAGRNEHLGALIPLRSWTVWTDADYRCVEMSHAMCAGFPDSGWHSVSGGSSVAGSISFGDSAVSMARRSDHTTLYNGAVVYEEGEGRGLQWAWWGNSGGATNQTWWWQREVIDLMDSSIEWLAQGPPRADAGGPYVAVAGDEVFLDAGTSSPRGDATIDTYRWVIGDEDWETSDSTALFDTSGLDGPVTVDVWLEVTDSEGRTGWEMTTLDISNADPVIDRVYCPSGLSEGDTGRFEATASDPEASDTLDFIWSVDGSPSFYGERSEYAFGNDGDYVVSLSVEDDDGGSDVRTCPDGVVTVSNVAPVITGTPPAVVDAGVTYSFEPGVTDPGSEDTHTWFLTDGPDEMAVTMLGGVVGWRPTIADVGTHSVTLSVNDGADVDTLTWTIEVQWPDVDGDGERSDTDCEDRDASIHTGAVEACDEVDSDCDGSLVDEFADLDGDENPDCIDPDVDGDGEPGTTDCDDLDASIYTGADEECDWIDSDCDGSLVDGFADGDEDGDPDCIDEDLDEDGMSDAWEERYGLDPTDPDDAGSDDDGDGRTALEEYGMGTDPTIYEGPGLPRALDPEDGGEVNELPAILSVIDAEAPLGQVLTHGMVLAADSGMAEVLDEVAGIEQDGTGNTMWVTAADLEENTWYYWTARASDEWTSGETMAVASFFVNEENEAPYAPGIHSPLDGSSAVDATLTVDVPGDPDNDAVSIIFTVELDSGEVVTSGPVDGSEETSSWTPSLVVDDGSSMCWSAYAQDEHLMDGPESETSCFTIDLTNEAPSAPVILEPGLDTVVDTHTPTVVVTNGADPELALTWHQFEIDTEDSFDSESLQSMEVESGADGTTSWLVDVVLPEDTWIHARVLCSDGEMNSDWVTTRFFVSEVNDPPSVPVLQDPESGMSLGDSDPLVVVNSVDPEGGVVTYDFRIMDLRDLDAGSVEGVEEGEDTTAWTPGALPEGHYQWQARAVDEDGLSSEWASPATFVVGSPDVVEPDVGGEVTEDEEKGCGCATARTGSTWLWFVPALLGWVRQRRRKPLLRSC